MVRWYKGFECIGKPQPVVEKIGDAVRTHKLARQVPVVRYERGSGKGQFYLFVGIESQRKGEIPKDVAECLLRLPCLSRPTRQAAFDLAEIKTMVGAEHQVADYGRHIQYWRPPPLPVADPFDGSYAGYERKEENQSAEAIDLCLRSDRLLRWLSATGSGSWDQFRDACRMLGLDGRGSGVAGSPLPRRLLRTLRLLGHIETSLSGDRWAIAPTVLARSIFPEEYVLCGARDDALVESLRQCGTVREEAQIDGVGPARITITVSKGAEGLHQSIDGAAADASPFGGLPSDVFEAGDASGRLARALPHWRGWLESLQIVEGVHPALYQTRRFDGHGFAESPFDAGCIGFYELWPLGTLNEHGAAFRPEQTLFYDASRQAWLRGDWYGLRFAALCCGDTEDEDRCCSIQYSHGAGYALAVPERWHWPEIYERALTLASGWLPRRAGDGWLVYPGVTPETVALLAMRLDLQVSNV